MNKNRKSEGGSPLERIADSFERTTGLVRQAAGLVGALTVLASQTIVLAGIFIGGYQPPVNQPLPKGCTPETLHVKDLPPYEAANEIFWQRHPEVHRRQIRRNEGKYSKEWLSDLDRVSRCRE